MSPERVIMCQRTHRWLDSTNGHDGRVVCPGPPTTTGCDGGEVYQLCTDSEAVDVVNVGLDYLVQLSPAFVRPLRPPEVWSGEYAETQHRDRDPLIVIFRNANPIQRPFQIAHELMHSVISAVDAPTHHWTHEMLAVLFSVDFLRHSGRQEAADIQDRHLQTQSESQTDVAAFAHTDVSTVGQIQYGRLYTRGRELLAIIGWEGLARLALVNDGAPQSPSTLRCFLHQYLQVCLPDAP